MRLDPQADPGRHVWVPCQYCGDNSGLYFLDYDVNFVWVQCGKCLHRWWHDTGCGRGDPSRLYPDVA